MAGQNFNINTTFGNSLATFSGLTTVTPPAAGNNPQEVDQVVSAANASATPGHTSGDQKIVSEGFTSADIGYSGSPVNTNGGGYGFEAKLITPGSGAWSVVIKFIASDNSTIKSYTLTAAQSVVARDAIGASADLGNVTVKQIDCTPSVDGAVVEVLGLLNLNT
jgi:hypothetical protein